MNRDKVVETNALLNTGSDSTLLRSDITTKLQLKGEDRKLNISSALSHRKNVSSKMVTIVVKLDEPGKSFDMKVWVIEPGRVRVVFDASAKYQDTSLNENLLPGIHFLNNLVNIITKFRTGKYTIIVDIDRTFHQVRVCESDIDALRFVSREKPEHEPLDYAMLVHLFGKVD